MISQHADVAAFSRNAELGAISKERYPTPSHKAGRGE
jgi:hypothetical protein